MRRANTPVTKQCPMCTASTTQHVPADVLASRAAGALIQDAWPNSTPAQREFLQTGYCPTCMTMLFGAPESVSERDEAIQRAIVATNTLRGAHEATARTFATIIGDRTYSDQDAWTCLYALEDLTDKS